MKPKFYTSIILFIFCLTGFPQMLGAQTYGNLLKNPGINSSLDHWNIVLDAHSGHKILPDQGMNGTGVIQCGFETKISQSIDLIEAGYSEEFLDSAPIVRFSDWIKGSGPNVNDPYLFEISLWDKNGNPIYSFHSIQNDIIATGEWQQVTHNIINYGPGLRKISITRIGQGAEFDPNNTVGVMMEAAYISINNHLVYADSKTRDFAGWTIEQNGGDGWVAQNSGFQTSYFFCSKSQIIDLYELGYTAEQLNKQPKVHIGENYIGYSEFSTGSGHKDFHYMEARLLNSNNEILDEFTVEHECSNELQYYGQDLMDYGEGLRYIYVMHGGNDQEFWAGHWGSIITGTTVTLDFPLNTSTQERAAIDQVHVFPNVVESGLPISIEIENVENGWYTVEIYDVNGIMIQESSIEKNEALHTENMNTDHLKSGMYFVQISNGKSTLSTRLIVM